MLRSIQYNYFDVGMQDAIIYYNKEVYMWIDTTCFIVFGLIGLGISALISPFLPHVSGVTSVVILFLLFNAFDKK